jgi:hypothetical protein
MWDLLRASLEVKYVRAMPPHKTKASRHETETNSASYPVQKRAFGWSKRWACSQRNLIACQVQLDGSGRDIHAILFRIFCNNGARAKQRALRQSHLVTDS